MSGAQGSSVQLLVAGNGDARVETGLPLLDHLLQLLVRYAGFDLALVLAPGGGDSQLGVAGRSLGEALAEPLRDPAARGHGSAHLPAAEALAHVALDVSEPALLVSNVDLAPAHVAGLDADFADRFLRELAAAAGVTLHVRLVEGRETEHVLDAIFKALGAALGAACRGKPGR
ncbi:MAG: imidazoleglycerol-phosphate dehydratase HisB [Gaiellaceae bacterium]